MKPEDSVKLAALNVGFAITGSFCTIEAVLTQMKKLAETGAKIIPIMSETAYNTDTRFYKAADLIKEVKEISGAEIIHTIAGAEPLGPKRVIDIMAVAPCTSNTLNKIAFGINDTAATMAVKSVLRNGVPVVISISTNDGLSASATGIGVLLNRKNIYFVPFAQDDPANKPRSVVAKNELLLPVLLAAVEGRQLQPILG